MSSTSDATQLDEEEAAPSEDERGDLVSSQAIIPWWAYLVAAFVLPLVLYMTMRPENYGLTPNNLDPFFYSGYAINFDDIMNAVGDRHYFVSRWSSYYPGYIADTIAGPFLGRLLLRLVYAALILTAVWRLGAWLRWNVAQNLMLGVVVLTMPMFVRAFFTEYLEYAVVTFGICLVVLCLRERQTWYSGLAVGTLAGLMVVANPVAITAVGLPIIACLWLGATGLRHRVGIAAWIAASGLLTVMAGLALFKWRYGIDNVYQPTLDFMRTHEDLRDPWKSPRLEWLWHYTWLWITPMVLLIAAGMAVRRSVRFGRIEVAALVLCGLQYVYQWLDQFVRDGDGLEVSYYWSYSLPTLSITLAIVVAKLTRNASWWQLALLTGVWLGVLWIGVPDGLRLPAGAGFFVGLVLLVGLIVACAPSRGLIGATLVLVAVGWMQVGAPRYDPSSYYPINSDPKYDQLFRQRGDLSETIYREAVWFEQQMDRIENDASTSFVVVGPWSSAISGLYAPHTIGRLVALEGTPPRFRLTDAAVAEIRLGNRPLIAVFGPPDEVAQTIETFPSDLGIRETLLDETHTSALGYRLVVFAMDDRSEG